MNVKTFAIQDILESIVKNSVRINDHAGEEAQADKISFDEIYYSVIHGEIIKSYPEDQLYPSGLILGFTFKGGPIHSVWAYIK